MRTVPGVLPRRRLAVVVATMLGTAACATAAGTNRVIAVIPGYPLESAAVHVQAGDRLTWVNGDQSRGTFRVEFDRVPGAPDLSTSSGVYTARFATPGTYAYTITAATRTGVALVARSGQVVVDGQAATAPAGSSSSTKPEPVASSPVPAEVPPVGPGISRVKGGPEVLAAYHYRPEQGIVLKVGRGSVEPAMLRPGAEIVLRVTYTVLVPPDGKPVSVKETRTVRYGDQDLRRLENHVTVSSGTYASEHRMTIPPDAAEGSYTVNTIVEIPAASLARGEVSSMFSVLAR